VDDPDARPSLENLAAKLPRMADKLAASRRLRRTGCSQPVFTGNRPSQPATAILEAAPACRRDDCFHTNTEQSRGRHGTCSTQLLTAQKRRS